MKSIIRRFILSLIILTPLVAEARILPWNQGRIHTPVGGTAVTVGQPSAVTSSSIDATTIAHFDRYKKGVVILGVDHHYSVAVSPGQTTIKVKVLRWSSAAFTVPDLPAQTIELSVNYDPINSLSFTDKHMIEIDGVERYEITIEEIKVNNVVVTTLPANLYVQADLYVDRIFDYTEVNEPLDFTPFNASTNLVDLDCDGIYDELKLTWVPNESVEEYQIEWTYVNNYDANGGTIPAADLNYDFRFNSTRISTTSCNYSITLAFDKGYICYRIRGVGRSIADIQNRIYSPWSLFDQGVVNSATFYEQTQAYEVGKNWQYSSTFAEEGKKKEVVSFFDGTLRNRQMVTKINSDDNTIVGETIYDHQGRPAVQVLPTPVNDPNCSVGGNESSLKYYKDFSRNEQGLPYSRVDFDKGTESETACDLMVGGMSPASGASNYYSPQNPDQTGEQGYLPDAEHFPFSQVEYTPDNTGRIRRQGGVGDDFQLGSGHESKFYYSHPSQIQLDRLFGSEVGDAAHYQKNMVIDPNGQVSVSYLDQEGRVIATSLAGAPPANLEALPSAATAGVTLTDDMMARDAAGKSTANQLSADGKTLQINETMSLSSPSDLVLNYSLSVPAYDETCFPAGVCFSCVYDLSIQVRDECGQELTNPALHSGMKGYFSVVSGNVVFVLDCAGHGTYSTNLTITLPSLPTGTYTITKTLTVNEDALDFYTSKYIDPQYNTCIKTLDYYEDQYMASANFEDCDNDQDCDECVAQLGTLESFLLADMGTQEDWEKNLADCKAPCQPISYCETIAEMMSMDMSPNGQYGEYQLPDGTIQPSNFPLSVYNLNNVLPQSQSTTPSPLNVYEWQRPKFFTTASSAAIAEYREEDGLTRTRVEVQAILDQTTGEVTSTNPATVSTTQVFLDAATGEHYTYPENLANVIDFVSIFKPSWARSLLYYHPEYADYRVCLRFTVPVTAGDKYTSESFDQLMMTVDTWQEAKDLGFVNETGALPQNRIGAYNLTTSPVWDPFWHYNFAGSTSAMNSKVFNYLTLGGTNYSMMEVAAMMVRCANSMMGNETPGLTCSNFGSNPTDLGFYATAAELQNAEWQTFRGLYISAKQTLQREFMIDQTVGASNYYGYNGCIGEDNFNPFENGFVNLSLSSFFNSQYFNNFQPCSQGLHHLYKYKERRFTSPLEELTPTPNEVAYQQYLQTGECPLVANLQSLLSEAAQENMLELATFTANELNFFSAVHLTLNDFVLTEPVPTVTWTRTGMTATSLSVELTSTSGDYGDFTLNKIGGETVSYTWADIARLGNMHYTSTVGNVRHFKISAKLSDAAGTVVQLTGSTSFALADCSFEEVCETNDLGDDLFQLITVITAAGKLHSTAAYQVQGGGAVYSPFVTNRIEMAANGAAANNFYWKHIAPATFELYSVASRRLQFSIISMEPTGTTLSQLVSLISIVPGDGNKASLVFKKADNTEATLECQVSYLEDGQEPVTVSLGDCALPDPSYCQGQAFDNYDDFPVLLADVLINQAPSYNLFASAYMTDGLAGQFPVGTSATTWSTENRLVGAHKDTRLTITSAGGCPLVLDIRRYAGEPTVYFGTITNLSNMVLTGESNPTGGYTDFYMVATFTSGSATVTDTIFGSTCFAMTPCEVCPAVMPGSGGTGEPCDLTISLTEVNAINATRFNGTPEPVNNSCYDMLEAVNDKIDEFNASNWATTNSVTLDQLSVAELAELRVLGYCTCAAEYVTYLDGYITETATPDYPAKTIRYFSCTSSPESDMEGNCETAFKVYAESIGELYASLTEGGPNAGVQMPYVFPYTGVAGYDLCNTCVYSYQAYIDGIVDGSTMIAPGDGIMDMQTLCSQDCELPMPDEPCTDYFDELDLDEINETYPETETWEQNCEDYLRLDLNDAITAYNGSAWGSTHNQLPTYGTVEQKTMLLMGKCGCIVDYINLLTSYTNSAATVVQPPMPALMDFAATGCPVPQGTGGSANGCVGAYQTYVAAVLNFTATTSTPFAYIFDYNDFVAADLCQCVDGYVDFLQSILDREYVLTNGEIVMDIKTYCDAGCTPSSDLDCQYCMDQDEAREFTSHLPLPLYPNVCQGNSMVENVFYPDLVSKIAAFNASPWAVSHNQVMESVSIQDALGFALSRECDCQDDYLTLMQQYISSSADASRPPMPSLFEFSQTGCEPVEGSSEDCEKSYGQYIYDVFAAARNPHPHKGQTIWIYDYGNYLEMGLCGACTDAFHAHVEDILAGKFQFRTQPRQYMMDIKTLCEATLPEPSACPVSVDRHFYAAVPNYRSGLDEAQINVCTNELNELISDIEDFNETSWASSRGIVLQTVFTTDEMLTMAIANRCACADGYRAYLLNFINNVTDPNPIVKNFTAFDCDRYPGTDSTCLADYDEYIETVWSFYGAYSSGTRPWMGGQPFPNIIFTYPDFVEAEVCGCVDDYNTYLSDIVSGTIQFNQYQFTMPIDLFCKRDCGIPPPPPCSPENPFTEVEMPVVDFLDPCLDFVETTVLANAQNAYNEYIALEQANFRERYIKHCMGAAESLTRTYSDKEYHYTLYYYDQAGNLVKTVPPEGVEMLTFTTYSDPTAQKIIADRANGTHQVMTSHRLESKYEYNSLNQLVRQSVPDMDKLDIFEIQLPNGLTSGLTTTAIQMINSNVGYLSGFVTTSLSPTNTRGYLYRTENGGSNWTKVNFTVAARLRKVQMVSSTIGFAIGESGVALRTSDGGASWDMIDVYGDAGIMADFRDLNFTSATSGVFISRTGSRVSYSATTGTVNLTATQLPFPIGYTSGWTFTDVKSWQPAGSDNLYAVTLTNTAGTESFDGIMRVSGLITSLDNIFGAGYSAVDFYSSTEGLAAGTDGNLVRLSGATTATFTQKMVPSGLTGTIDQLIMFNRDRGFARVSTGAEATIWVTYNGGATWTKAIGDANVYTRMSVVERSATRVVITAHTAATQVRRLILGTTGDVTVVDETPATTQNLDFTATATLVDGSNTWYFGVTANRKLYRSNPLTSAGQDVNYTEIFTIPGTTGITVRKFIPVKLLTGELNISVLNSNNQLQRVVSNIAGTVFTAYSINPLIGTAAFVDIAVRPNLPNPFLVTYDNTGRQVHRALIDATTGNKFTTAILGVGTAPVAATVTSFSFLGNKATVVGSNGTIFTTTDIVDNTAALTWTERTNLRGLPIEDIHPVASGQTTHVAVGVNGLVLQCSTPFLQTPIWKVTPVAKTKDLKSLTAITTTPYIVGAGSEAFSMNLTTSVVTDLATANATPVKTTLGGQTLNHIAVSGNQAYIVGDAGTVLYTSNITTTGLSFVENNQPVNFYGASVVPGQTGNEPRVIVVGDNGRVFRYKGITGTETKQVFGPRMNDVHFANLSMGTIVGTGYFVRKTTDAGLNWQIVLPSATSGLSAVINNVWTKPTTGGAHFALLGGANYFATVFNGTATPQTLTGTMRDIQFRTAGTNVGYAAVNNNLRSITLASSTTLGYTATISNTLITSGFTPLSSTALNAIHVFENGGIMAVGTNSTIVYRNPSGQGLNLATGLPASQTFNDVFFHDDRVGYVVGNSGAFYRTNGVTATGSNVITGVSWVSKTPNIIANEVFTVATAININAIAFGSRHHGIWGGVYTNGTTNTNQPTPYVRLLNDESGEYTSRFFYDRLGRIVVSQNQRQYAALPSSKFSYTLYDALGRVYEAGEKQDNAGGTTVPKFASVFGAMVGGLMVPSVVDDAKLATWLNTQGTSTRKEVTRSYFDVTNALIASTMSGSGFTADPATQRKRIVHMTYEEIYDANDQTYDHATHYDYDIHGNVKTLIQDNKRLEAIPDIALNRFKRLDYNYDLISGNVHRVDYQTGKIDQWHHAYTYDSDNRITAAYTTTTTPITNPAVSGQTASQNEPGYTAYWDREVKYSFFEHGPLARIELGEEQVQGLDYNYTIDGPLKGVNSNTLDPSRDPGQDGLEVNTNRKNVSRDVMGFSLHYFEDDLATIGQFEGDYVAINANNSFIANQSSSELEANANGNLYNGNIGRMITTITDPNTRTILPLGNVYRYDQLNRLLGSVSFDDLNLTLNSWGTTGSGKYQNSFQYDANGNIIFQMRADENGQIFDFMTYRYNVNTSGEKIQNRLYHVNELSGLSGLKVDDIDDQGLFISGVNINTANNYRFDAEGRLIYDKQEEIANIIWRMDGKIKEVVRTSGSTKKNVSFDYDALGRRIAKHVYNSNNQLENSTYYLLDGSGTTLSIYERNVDGLQQSVTYKQTERHLFGLERLGVLNEPVNTLGSVPMVYSMVSVTHKIGERAYELNNHLGNVLSVISDKPIPNFTTIGGAVNYFMADIKQSSDYSPFGVTLGGRNLFKTGSNDKFRFGFNGMEIDAEIKGDGNSYTTEFRQYDPRLGRWLTSDPLCFYFESESPYSAFSNSPIYFTDPTGLAPEGGDDPEKITVDYDKNKPYTSDYLPASAKDKQIIELNTGNGTNIIATFSSDQGKWLTQVQHKNSATGEVELSEGIYQAGTATETMEEVSNKAHKIPEGAAAPKTTETSDVLVSERVDEAVDKAGKAVGTTDLLNQGVEAAAKSTEAELKKKIKFVSKVKSIPQKVKSKFIASVGKAANKFGKLAKIANIGGKILGIGSALSETYNAAKVWKNPKSTGAQKAWATTKAALAWGSMLLKANPVGLAASILLSVGTAWIDSWW